MAGLVYIGDDVGLVTIAETAVRLHSNFLKVVTDAKPGNLITSALSAQVVLAMAAYGARGKTATEMCSVLLLPDDNGLGKSGYKSVIEYFNFQFLGEVELRLANKIYTASGVAVKSAYKELTTEQFFSASQEVDFKNPTVAANAINTWCEEQTNKRVKDIINPDQLDPDTKMVLVNAVYFKGQWEDKFDPKLTEDRPFHVDETTTKSVPTMYIEEAFKFGDLPKLNARFIEIPYQGYQLSMIIILPNEVTGLKSVLENLHQLNLSESLLLSKFWPNKLFLPKFRIETTLDLEKALMKLGMIDMFGNAADFSGITDIPLKVSKVIQKAIIEVNEEGREAAAATMSGLKSVQENLHQLNLSGRLQRSLPREIKLFLPKFRIKTTLDLEKALKKLGMTDMFSDWADFSGISDIPLKVSKVIQKAFIEVNEEGSEAACVTVVKTVLFSGMTYQPPPLTFKVDHLIIIPYIIAPPEYLCSVGLLNNQT